MKVRADQDLPTWEESESARIAHDGCPNHWHSDLRRSNAALNDASMEDLTKHFEPLGSASKKNDPKKKK